MVSHDFPLIRETFTGLLIHKSHHSSLVFFAFLDKNTPRKMMEKAFLSVYVSKFSGGACPQTPLEPRAFGARLPRRLLFQYSLLLKNLLKALC